MTQLQGALFKKTYHLPQNRRVSSISLQRGIAPLIFSHCRAHMVKFWVQSITREPSFWVDPISVLYPLLEGSDT